ncbi:hypothetical protein Barb7_02123 [Bacteroidales bacterium Barb7]|nr:hypothetical protein Barb7_02123 [Bacteroidales bacterium Barb7]
MWGLRNGRRGRDAMHCVSTQAALFRAAECGVTGGNAAANGVLKG